MAALAVADFGIDRRLVRTLVTAFESVRPRYPYPWQEPPETSQYFHRMGALVTPAPPTTDAVAVTYTTPEGLQAVVTHLLIQYRGTGQILGDANTISFALRRNLTTKLQDFALITVNLGTLEDGPWPIPGRIRLQSGDVLEGLVTVPAGSPVLTGTTFVHFHLLGWEWPGVSEDV